jgi:surfeit locus 1 family protein
LSHVLVVALVAVMIAFGFWQLRRLDERQTRNAQIEARGDEPVQALDEVMPIDAEPAQTEAVRYRPVVAVGEYEADSDVVVRNRTYEGQPGSWLLATLRLDSGDAVVVSRGWIPLTGEQEPTAAMLAPSGPVVVEGTLETTQERGRFGSTDPAEGVLQRVARVDVDRLAEQIDGSTYPGWIQVDQERPQPGDLPVPVEPPDLSEGSHFSYAMQWFTFATIALLGYPLVLRRVARQKNGETAVEGPPAWDDGTVTADG